MITLVNSNYNLNIRVGMVNAQSFKPKELSIFEFLKERNLDIWVLSETWLQGEDESLAWCMGSELNRNWLYFMQSKKRNKKGGGLGLAHSINIDSILIREEE